MHVLLREPPSLKPKPDLSRSGGTALIEAALRRFYVAAERGYHVLLIEAEKEFSALTRADGVRVVVHCGGAWHTWDGFGYGGGDASTVPLPIEAASWHGYAVLDGRHFVPVRPGALAVMFEQSHPAKDVECIAGTLAAGLNLALLACERSRLPIDENDEIGVMQRVAMRILKSRDLQEILLLITHETKQLLGADICGIMLREGDAVVMQRCVGNFSADVASLRMKAGQGLAGRVLATKEPCHVDNYLQNDVISNDFMNLARTELVRSALGAPLMSQEDIIGVLEVWRRETSKFDEHDTRRLVALANLTSVAIENARLSQARETMVHELIAANQALLERYEVIRSSGAFQNELIRLLVEGRSLDQVAGRAAAHVAAEVLILDANLEVEGASPPCDELPAPMREKIRAALRAGPAASAEMIEFAFDGKVLLLQPVVAGSERLGAVVLSREAPADESSQLALSQVCLATSLHRLEQRAAARARAETLGAVLWDLLEGQEDVRRYAVARARELHVDLEGRKRVFLCALDGIEQHAASENWSATELETRRRRIAQAYRTVAGLADCVKLAGMRGNFIALICGGEMLDDAERLGNDLAAAIASQVTGLCVQVGISAPCNGSSALSAAYREARISLEVARQRGSVAAARYEDAGIVGLLLSLREEADVRKLVRMIFGPLLDEKPQTRDVLLGTIEAFFELNCSRQAAARKLRVHEKTIVYRLAKIEHLTGLDFSKHEKRLLADIALRMYGMTNGRAGWRAISADGG